MNPLTWALFEFPAFLFEFLGCVLGGPLKILGRPARILGLVTMGDAWMVSLMGAARCPKPRLCGTMDLPGRAEVRSRSAPRPGTTGGDDG